MVVKFQVFKKSSPNKKITLFVPKRDYIDHVTYVDRIEGVLALDPNYVQEKKVFVELAVTFSRFGGENDESMGYNFVKTMGLQVTQLYPPIITIKTSEIQKNLISKLGNFVFPFSLEFPELGLPSYTMMQGWQDGGTLTGLEYEIVGFMGDNQHDMQKRSTSKLVIRRLMECPSRVFEMPPPDGSLTRTFLTCSGTVNIKASINSSAYYPEEEILLKVALRNSTSRELKRIKVKVVQLSEVPMFHNARVRDKTIIKIDDPLNLPPGGCTNNQFTLLPVIPVRQARGMIFVQTNLKGDGKDILAPTTILNPKVNKHDLYGVFISYLVRIKVTLGALMGDTILDIPFTFAVPQGRRTNED